MSLCSLLNISRKGVQAARIPGPLLSPADSLFPARKRIGGIFVSNAINTSRFQVNRDGRVARVCFCSARVFGPEADPDSSTI